MVSTGAFLLSDCSAMSAPLIGGLASSAFRLSPTLQCRCRSRARASMAAVRGAARKDRLAATTIGRNFSQQRNPVSDSPLTQRSFSVRPTIHRSESCGVCGRLRNNWQPRNGSCVAARIVKFKHTLCRSGFKPLEVFARAIKIHFGQSAIRCPH